MRAALARFVAGFGGCTPGDAWLQVAVATEILGGFAILWIVLP